MSLKTLAVVFAALLPVGCGSLAPSSPDDPLGSGGAGAGGSISSSAAKPATRPNPGALCQADSLSLSVARDSDVRITATYLDAQGRPILPNACPAVSWSASPAGASLVPVTSADRRSNQVRMIVTGSGRAYTVSATAGSMNASVDVKF